MPRLNSEERARILAMLEWGRTQEQVARRFNVSLSTIWCLVRRVRVTGTFADRPRSGSPRVTSVRQDNFIFQCHLRDRFVTSESSSRVVVGNCGRPISRYTVRRRLRESGITCRRPYRGLVLILRHRHQRLIGLATIAVSIGRTLCSATSRVSTYGAPTGISVCTGDVTNATLSIALSRTIRTEGAELWSGQQ